MWIFKKKVKEPSKLDKLIDDCMDQMLVQQPDDDTYADLLERLKELHKLRDHERSRKKVSPDALASAISNVLGIGLIVGHERAHVITSKAMGLISKPKI